MITINVSGDGRINTRDAIDIVDNFVSGKELNIFVSTRFPHKNGKRNVI